MFRKIVICVGSFVGIALIVLSFLDRDVPTAPSGPEEEQSGQLQLDTVPLGTLTLVADGVFAGNSRGEIRHFSLTGDGKTPAVYSVCSNAISAAVLLWGECYFVGDENGVFHAFQPGTGERWSYRTGNQITGGAVMSGNLVWVGSHDHTLYAFDPQNGECRHEVECGGQINATPVIDPGQRYLFLGNCDGKLRRIDIRTGNVSGELDFESPIPAQPVLCDGLLYVRTHGGELIAVDAEGWTVRWRQSVPTGSVAAPFVTGTIVVANLAGKTFPVFDRTSGEPIGSLEADEPLTPIQAGSDSVLYGVTCRGKLYRWNREGSVWRRTQLADFQADCSTGCVRYGNRLLIADEGGGLFYYLEGNRDAP